MYDPRLFEELNRGFGNKDTWKKIPLIFGAVAVILILGFYWKAHRPPYWVRLNPETDYGGVVYLYENMNPMSSPRIDIPVETICIRLDGRVYTIDFDPPLHFYRLQCQGASGYARIHQVILP